jgi:hypothetical protein
MSRTQQIVNVSKLQRIILLKNLTVQGSLIIR